MTIDCLSRQHVLALNIVPYIPRRRLVLCTRRQSLKGFTAKTPNPVLRIQPCMLQIKLPVTLLVGVKIGKGAESV